MSTRVNGRLWVWSASIVAILFGLLTIREGGAVLFWSEEARRAAGQYVPFVVWFNFLAGFAYVIAGFGLWFRQRWAAGVAFVVAATTLVATVSSVVRRGCPRVMLAAMAARAALSRAD